MIATMPNDDVVAKDDDQDGRGICTSETMCKAVADEFALMST
jgi:hypothetical protein